MNPESSREGGRESSLTTRGIPPTKQKGWCKQINETTRNTCLITDGGRVQDTEGLHQVVRRRPIVRWIGDEKVPANPVTEDVVDGAVGTPLIPRRRIAGKHVNLVRSEAVPVRGYRDGRFVLAVAPEHASVDVFDPGERDAGDPLLEVTGPWVPLAAVFTAGEKRPVVVPRKEVDL